MAKGSTNKDMIKLMRDVPTWEGWRVEDKPIGWRVYPPNGLPAWTVSHGPRRPDLQLRYVTSRLRREGAPL